MPEDDWQKKFSNVSNILEITRTTYNLYETGKRDIPVNILSKLAKLYNTSIDYIIGETDKEKPYHKTIL